MKFKDIFSGLKQITMNTVDIGFIKAKLDILTGKINKDISDNLTNINSEVANVKDNLRDVGNKLEKVKIDSATGKIDPAMLPAYVETVTDVYRDENTGIFYNVEVSIDPITQLPTYSQGSTEILKAPGVIYCDVSDDKTYRVSDTGKVIEITTSTLYYTKQEVDSMKLDKLTSGTNIKTINGNSILGEGDIEVSGLYTINSELIKAFNVNSLPSLDYSNYNSPQEFIDYLDQNGYLYNEFGNLCQEILLNIDLNIVIVDTTRIGLIYVQNKSVVTSKYIITNPTRIILTFFNEGTLIDTRYVLRNIYENIWISSIELKHTTPFIVEFTPDYNTEELNESGILYSCSINKTTALIHQAWDENRRIYAYNTNDGTMLHLSMPPLDDIAVFSGIWVEFPNVNLELRIWDNGEALYTWFPLLKLLYFDAEPTENSNENILTSGSVFNALSQKLDKILFGSLVKNIFTKGKFIKVNKSTVYQSTSGEITPQEGTLYVDIQYGKIYTWFSGGVGFVLISGIRV